MHRMKLMRRTKLTTCRCLVQQKHAPKTAHSCGLGGTTGLVNVATALSVALEIIRGQQEQIVARAQERWGEGDLPPLARFVMQFEPWQLAAIGALTALLLVLMPATLFIWELRQLLH